MTSARRRALDAARGRKHRRLRKQGMSAYTVWAHEQRLIDRLQDWGMPDHLTWRHDLAEAAVGDLVALMISDKVIVDRIHALIAAKRGR